MRFDSYINILISILTILGFVIGFISPEFRMITWSLSIIVLVVFIMILIFRDYITKIKNNEYEIKEIKKDLNILNRLSKLEGKIEVIEKRK